MLRGITILFILCALGAAFIACTSGNGGLPANRLAICQPGWNPIQPVEPTNVPNKLMHISKGDPITQIPNGDYGYLNSYIFYYDTMNDIKIYFQEVQDPVSGQFIPSIQCLAGSGINKDMSPLSETIPFVSDFLVQNGAFAGVRHRTMTFSIAKPQDTTTAGYLTGPLISTFDLQYASGSPLHTYDADTEFSPADQYILDENPTPASNAYALISLLEKPGKWEPSSLPPTPTPLSTTGPGVVTVCPPETVCVFVQTDVTQMTPAQRDQRDQTLKLAVPTPTPSPSGSAAPGTPTPGPSTGPQPTSPVPAPTETRSFL